LAHGRRLARQVAVLGLDKGKMSFLVEKRDQQQSAQR
jgi:hypothetical protein